MVLWGEGKGREGGGRTLVWCILWRRIRIERRWEKSPRRRNVLVHELTMCDVNI